MLSGQGKPAARSAVERLRGKFADQGAVQGEVEDMAKSCQSNQAKAGKPFQTIGCTTSVINCLDVSSTLRFLCKSSNNWKMCEESTACLTLGKDWRDLSPQVLWTYSKAAICSL